MKIKFRALEIAVFCIAIFIIQSLVSGFTDLFVLNSRAIYEPWRFLTAIFLHGSLPHLIYNMFALILFGTILEYIIGSKRFMIVFFVSGVVANFISFPFYNSALGASGAIYGVIGALVAIRPTMAVWAFGLPMPMFVAGIIWVTGDILGIFMPSNVANIAHLAGIFVGFLIGFLYRKDYKIVKERNERIFLNEKQMRNWEDYYLK